MINYKIKSEELRKTIFNTICQAGGGHLPASLSIVEILTVLYYSGMLKVAPQNLKDPDRDRFILSKGHACVALYAVLADKGFFDKKHLSSFGKRNSILGGHPDMHAVPGVEASTGALGHGFPFGVGQALAGKLDKKDYRVYVVLGDGECQEGSVWEAAFFATQYKLDNIVAIIDYNKLQALDRLDNIVSLEPLKEKWEACGWNVKDIDGHDVDQLHDALDSTRKEKGKPHLIIANTIKGKGISFMENQAIWHFRMPNDEEMKVARRELGIEK